MAAHNQQHYRSPFGDTTFTKVFVGGLAWETPTHVMQNYFQQFGEILEAVIINDKNTGKSKGYGFVTFRDPESANRACAEPNPVIDGRRANCNIASLGRPSPRPSPPRGRNQMENLYQGIGIASSGSPTYPPPLPPPTPVIYPPYGYTAYPQDYGYHQTMYNQQAQYYNPYYYGYAAAAAAARGTFNIPTAQRFQGPSYLYYPTQVESSSSPYPPPPHPNLLQPTRLSFPSYAGDSGVPPQTSTETEAGNATSTSSIP